MKLKFALFVLLMSVASVSARTFHISKSGSDSNDGTERSPMLTISCAAERALSGDTILIHEGVYRERVSPANSGRGFRNPIVYMAAEGEEVWIKGSEVVTGWKKGKGGLWTISLSNEMFGDFNPFAINLFGDWLARGQQFHLGELYLNGKTFSEVVEKSELSERESSWYVEVDDASTTIIANFAGVNPNKETTEINVRESCFKPKATGINYITVKGLNIAQAATHWSPPTGEQTGIVAPNWSKGWVVEDCFITQSKCVGICLGKERASGHNLQSLYTADKYKKHGFNREIEAILKAYDLGWSKENIGSHTIANNRISECGQAGIVGHLGAAFSTISHNEIYDINTDKRIGGAEIAGIKLHAAIDAVIENNAIYNTTMGIWLDWQAQGTKVVGNVIGESQLQDLFIEVSHGPTMVYNNLLLSDCSLRIVAQGVMFANNLFRGVIVRPTAQARYTPYHEPHSTKVKGFYNNTGGDNRYFNNIFLASASEKTKGDRGLSTYADYPTSMEEIVKLGVVDDYLKVNLPVWMGGNIYFGKDAAPHAKENAVVRSSDDVTATLERGEDGRYYLRTNLSMDMLSGVATRRIDTESMGMTLTSEWYFENADGTDFVLSRDFYGEDRNVDSPVAGPFESEIRSLVW